MKRLTEEECNECGAQMFVNSECDVDGMYFDGDELTCSECGATAFMTCEDGNAHITYNDPSE